MPDSEKYSILITGACGFIGRHLVDKLLRTTNADILVCCRDKKGFPKTNQRLKLFQADLLRPNSFGSIFQQYKPRHIIHLAALARLRQGEENPELAVQTNFFGSRFLIDLAIKHKADSFVLLSSNLARKPKSVVGITKLLGEEYIQKKTSGHTRLMTLRLPNVPDSPASVTLIFKKQIEENQEITITDPEMSRVFVNLDEAGIFIQHLLDKGKNKDTFVVTKKPTKITELAQKMIRESGKEIAIKYIGIQSGEKLEEEPYPKEFIEETIVNGLSLYNKEGQSTEEITQSLSVLQRKLPQGKAGLKTIKQIEKVLSLK
jgi:FlaA1/EpsC-like NDP-sugar epimerase